MSENNKLYVGNLPFASTAQDLEALFGQVGTVNVVEIIFDKFTGRSRGFAFVTMANGDEAQKGVEKFHGHEIDGRALAVNIARPREERPARSFEGAAAVNAAATAAAGVVAAAVVATAAVAVAAVVVIAAAAIVEIAVNAAAATAANKPPLPLSVQKPDARPAFLFSYCASAGSGLVRCGRRALPTTGLPFTFQCLTVGAACSNPRPREQALSLISQLPACRTAPEACSPRCSTLARKSSALQKPLRPRRVRQRARPVFAKQRVAEPGDELVAPDRAARRAAPAARSPAARLPRPRPPPPGRHPSGAAVHAPGDAPSPGQTPANRNPSVGSPCARRYACAASPWSGA
jgi:cold-inducible RNA-binding protein